MLCIAVECTAELQWGSAVGDWGAESTRFIYQLHRCQAELLECET